MADVQADPDALRETMKKVAVTLKGAGIPFALAGGYAGYARGGPESDHDVDFYLRRDDVEAAEKALAAADLRVEHPPEDWLVKVFDGDAMVDLIHSPSGVQVDEEMLARTEQIEVASVEMPVLSATDLLASKLMALREHYCDFSSIFPVARALREQVDWVSLDERTDANPFARAFLWLAAELDLRDPPPRI